MEKTKQEIEKLDKRAAHAENPNKTMALVIGIGIGLIGIFGIGHIYLRYKQKGYIFLGMTAILYLLGLVATFFSEGLWGYLPPVWGIMWLVQTYDLYRLTKGKTHSSGI